MAVTRVAGSSRATGTTLVNAAYPAGLIAGDLVIAHRSIKPSTATAIAEAGWVNRVDITGGTGAAGVDVGTTRCALDSKLLVGSESGSVGFDQGSTPDTVIVQEQLFRATSGLIEIITNGVYTGNDSTHGTGRADTLTGTDPLMRVGDMIAIFATSDTDAVTAYTHAVSATGGITVGSLTEHVAPGGSSTGNDVGNFFLTCVVTGGGTGKVALNSTGGPSACGPTGYVVLRERIHARPIHRARQPQFRAGWR